MIEPAATGTVGVNDTYLPSLSTITGMGPP